MKEATADLNSTVVVVLMVGVLSAFFFGVMWPMMSNSIRHDTSCSDAICSSCPSNNCQTVECYSVDDSGRRSDTFDCVYKG